MAPTKGKSPKNKLGKSKASNNAAVVLSELEFESVAVASPPSVAKMPDFAATPVTASPAKKKALVKTPSPLKKNNYSKRSPRGANRVYLVKTEAFDGAIVVSPTDEKKMAYLHPLFNTIREFRN